jgi:hypothetical protein
MHEIPDVVLVLDIECLSPAMARPELTGNQVEAGANLLQ